MLNKLRVFDFRVCLRNFLIISKLFGTLPNNGVYFSKNISIDTLRTEQTVMFNWNLTDYIYSRNYPMLSSKKAWEVYSYCLILSAQLVNLKMTTSRQCCNINFLCYIIFLFFVLDWSLFPNRFVKKNYFLHSIWREVKHKGSIIFI